MVLAAKQAWHLDKGRLQESVILTFATEEMNQSGFWRSWKDMIVRISIVMKIRMDSEVIIWYDKGGGV